MENVYVVDFNEAFRGDSDVSGGVYSGKSPEIGWVWKFTRYTLERSIEEEANGSYKDITNATEIRVLFASNVVFDNIEEAKADAVETLKTLEPDMGRHSPINEALKYLVLGRY